VSGTLALVGSGEFLETMRPIDAMLLERAKPSGRAHVVVIPTAAIPDGPHVVERWASMGHSHFAALGATVDVVVIGADDRANDSAVAQRIAAADLVYMSGGKPRFLLNALKGSSAWDAVLAVLARGGVIVGCSAGAMVLGESLFGPPRPSFSHSRRKVFLAFGLVPITLIIPHYDRLPCFLRGLILRILPADWTVLGTDENTALIQNGEQWQVLGRSGVELRRAGKRTRFASGEHLML